MATTNGCGLVVPLCRDTFSSSSLAICSYVTRIFSVLFQCVPARGRRQCSAILKTINLRSLLRAILLPRALALSNQSPFSTSAYLLFYLSVHLSACPLGALCLGLSTWLLCRFSSFYFLSLTGLYFIFQFSYFSSSSSSLA